MVGAQVAQLALARVDLAHRARRPCARLVGEVGRPGLGQRQASRAARARDCRTGRTPDRVAEGHQGGVDPVLERGPVADQVEPEAGPLALGADRWDRAARSRAPVAPGQLGQHPSVDPVGLAGQRGQALDLLARRRSRPPSRQLEGVVDEAGTGHRLDGGARPVRQPERSSARASTPSPSRSGRRGRHR